MASVEQLLLTWRQYREPRMWPASLTVTLHPVVRHILERVTDVSLSALLIEWKRLDPDMARASIDILNLKAYLRCFKAVCQLRRHNRVDYARLLMCPNVRPAITDHHVAAYVRMHGIDAVFFGAMREALALGVKSPVLFTVAALARLA